MVKSRLTDQAGYLQKVIAIKRLERYANEINMVLTKYNKKSCNESMLIKGVRKSREDSTNRKTHAEELSLVAVQIAKRLKLNKEFTRIIGEKHDIGHTFFGHSGEWWLSNILEDYGLGNFYHSALGASELIYTRDVYDEIIETIKAHNPNISDRILGKIRNNLWLIMDAINAHNGEKVDAEFIPNTKKQEKDFEQEIMNCFAINGYDRKIIPATTEACLMRLADKIAYIPLDMVDGLKEGLVRDEQGNIVDYLDSDYQKVLLKLGITQEEIDTANLEKDYMKIAEKIKTIFINDVAENSTKRRIRMSKEMLLLMGELLKTNNEKAVNNVVLKEDQAIYPPAIRELINRFSNIILENNILSQLGNENTGAELTESLAEYQGTPYEEFAEYILMMKPRDFKLSQQIAEEATKQSVEEELSIAKRCVQTGEEYEDKEELGLDYSSKNGRIRSYIDYYKHKQKLGKLESYSDQNLEDDIRNVMANIANSKKSNKNYLSMDERVATIIAARYMATLNDVEFMRLLIETKLITKEQYDSLTRKYKDIKDLKNEVHMQKSWKAIEKLQKQAIDSEREK